MTYQEEIVARWEQEPKAVTLTNDQWNTLETYILSSTQYRKAEGNAWDSLIQKKNTDGSPKFPSAAGNARYYAELEIKLGQILENIKKA